MTESGRSTRHGRARSGYAAFDFGYHSESRRYSMNGEDRSERSSGMERYRGDQRSNSADNRHSDEGRGTGEEGGPESGTAAGVATMSINSPSAQDSWHGYDVDCPEANADK